MGIPADRPQITPERGAFSDSYKEVLGAHQIEAETWRRPGGLSRMTCTTRDPTVSRSQENS
ncbi:hypothetical protein FFA01_25070 [Frigoribacterium faeni]|uniref:Uncharacterized protein n=1 Tax=Frigoribacterium faeni TaxID=145483 RepID=A0ABQ0US51_9MICO|nr:hypothetical protein GCM10025699_43620 [Microbacterium flavescens]GEK84198.1 hypothetical protein FFA01_25070 [Frigoribacterium faeni]